MSSIALSHKAQKLMKLCDIEGFENVEDVLFSSITDTVCPAICMSEGCDHTAGLRTVRATGGSENVATWRSASAFTHSGSSSTPEVIMTLPPENVCRKASLSAQIRSAVIDAPFDGAGARTPFGASGRWRWSPDGLTLTYWMSTTLAWGTR
jgi:hypothetical protein